MTEETASFGFLHPAMTAGDAVSTAFYMTLSCQHVRRHLLGAMKHRQYIYLLFLDTIDDPVWPLYDLPDILSLVFRNDSSGMWKHPYLFGSSCQTVNQPIRVDL